MGILKFILSHLYNEKINKKQAKTNKQTKNETKQNIKKKERNLWTYHLRGRVNFQCWEVMVSAIPWFKDLLTYENIWSDMHLNFVCKLDCNLLTYLAKNAIQIVFPWFLRKNKFVPISYTQNDNFSISSTQNDNFSILRACSLWYQLCVWVCVWVCEWGCVGCLQNVTLYFWLFGYQGKEDIHNYTQVVN